MLIAKIGTEDIDAKEAKRKLPYTCGGCSQALILKRGLQVIATSPISISTNAPGPEEKRAPTLMPSALCTTNLSAAVLGPSWNVLLIPFLGTDVPMSWPGRRRNPESRSNCNTHR